MQLGKNFHCLSGPNMLMCSPNVWILDQKESGTMNERERSLLSLLLFLSLRGAREVAASGPRTVRVAASGVPTAAAATSGVRGAQTAKVEAVVNGKPTAPAASPTPTQVVGE